MYDIRYTSKKKKLLKLYHPLYQRFKTLQAKIASSIKLVTTTDFFIHEFQRKSLKVVNTLYIHTYVYIYIYIYIYIYVCMYKAKLKNELTPSRKETEFFSYYIMLFLCYFFLPRLRTCVLDHRII